MKNIYVVELTGGRLACDGSGSAYTGEETDIASLNELARIFGGTIRLAKDDDVLSVQPEQQSYNPLDPSNLQMIPSVSSFRKAWIRDASANIWMSERASKKDLSATDCTMIAEMLYDGVNQ